MSNSFRLLIEAGEGKVSRKINFVYQCVLWSKAMILLTSSGKVAEYTMEMPAPME